MQDGFVHTALQVGAHVLHWFDNSLVYMKEWHSEEAILALDVGTLDLNLIDDQARLKKAGFTPIEHHLLLMCMVAHLVDGWI